MCRGRCVGNVKKRWRLGEVWKNVGRGMGK